MTTSVATSQPSSQLTSQAVAEFYPFLNAPSPSDVEPSEPLVLEPNDSVDVVPLDRSAFFNELVDSVRRKAAESRDVQDRYFDSNAVKIAVISYVLAEAFRNGKRLLSIGNGGSSSDAAHIAVEFLHPIGVGKKPLEAIDLSANTTSLTAISNDFGFEQVFARQLLSTGRAGDVLIGLSTSGNSKNILAAFAQAKQMGIVTIALVGGDGGKMATSPDVDYCLVVPHTSIHRIQESHLPTYHILWDLVHSILESR